MINNYTAPKPIEQHDYRLTESANDYDFNFCFEVPTILSTGDVSLEPLVVSDLSTYALATLTNLIYLQPSLHAVDLHRYLLLEPELAKWLPYGPFDTLSEYLTFLEEKRRESGTLLFVIRDLSIPSPSLEHPNSNIAGVVGVLNVNSSQRLGEIGHIQIFKLFQRSHVGTHTIQLLQSFLLDRNKVRRCTWFANTQNRPSIDAAQRMGFRLEAVQYYARVLPAGKVGVVLPEWVASEEENNDVGRHSAVLVIDWDEWFTEVKEKVEKLLARKVLKRDASSVGR